MLLSLTNEIGILAKRSLNALPNWLIPIGDSLQIILMIQLNM